MPLDLSTLRANTLTGEPLLRLLIALEGEEPGEPSPAVAWRAYQEFLRIPASGEDDASFQTEWLEGDTTIFHVTFTRQLTDEVAGFGRLSHQVAIEYSFEVPHQDRAKAAEIWRSDCQDLEEYFRRVAAHPAFVFCRDNGTYDRLVFTVESKEE